MTQRLKLTLLLAASVIFGVLMVMVRVYFSGTLSYTFLLWNLFLALIPFGLSSLLLNVKLPAPLFWLTTACWLLFFPNAPYVLTDLLHLRPFMVPVWYDLLMLISFAWTSLMLGFVSLSDMQGLIRQRSNQVIGWLFVGMALGLGSFGIYLGRFLRWNSWDVLTQPKRLLSDILEPLINPLSNISTYGFTLLLTAFLLLAYLTMQFFQGQRIK
jgi:uncharacterized membrane protein